MRISVTRIAPRGGFSFAILAQTRIELARPFLIKGFSYHTCFYTSNLNAFYYAIHFIGAGVCHLLFKILWSGLFYYHIRNLASKYIRFNLTSNSSLLFLISATFASLILYIQFLTQVSPLQSLHIYEYTNIENFVFKLTNTFCLVSEDTNHFLYVLCISNLARHHQNLCHHR